MRSLVRFWIPWVVGVCVAVFAISLWRREELDSTLLVTMILGGLIGGLVASGVKKVVKKDKE